MRTDLLRQLTKDLRDQSVWPVGFIWRYERLEQCGLGLVGAMNGVDATDITGILTLLDISVQEATQLFTGVKESTIQIVTPEMVSDHITLWLEKHS